MNFVVLYHNELKECFIFINEEKAEKFIEVNTKIWDKYKVDPLMFKFRKGLIKDNELLDELSKSFPEEFL